MELPADVNHFALTNNGVVTGHQLESFGLGRERQAQLAAAGVLHRLIRGVYTPRAIWDDACARRNGSTLLKIRAVSAHKLGSPHPAGAISHFSAALAWDLPLLRTRSDVHIVRPSCRGGRSSDGIVSHHSDLDEGAVELEHGVVATRLDRTVADACASTTFTEAVVIADAALARLVGNTRLQPHAVDLAQEPIRGRLLALVDKRRPRGAATARKAIEFADCRTESPAESRARIIFSGMPLPPPIPQLEVRTDRARRYPDFAFAQLGVLVEVDGFVKVRDPLTKDAARAVENERLRHIELQEAGWEIVRLSWADLANPQIVLTRVLKAAARAKRRGILV
ncbi:type IV toxin-antitoxin system AbiEi family antitoxin domain-containing protein [Spelaeicoccus albus]|uniref:Transcriptional regulator, AbiEi antitoxin, Type IV TA system n=1 Tax=Spelaeicoccus albus TaxID=1280376 RepID=A0A7Z0IJB2_9MICO|nr:type IV toxin-antitoxin system AbiEi family antitoxin domain-containing protein [Spelaeicoccus albus]NYI69333.1 hypothetical protein [Spelaeicoccus albus]